jgi:hypothetical protein
VSIRAASLSALQGILATFDEFITILNCICLFAHSLS